MRITSSMVTRNYTKQLNQTYSRYMELFNQSTTGMRFTKMSEDTASGVRAMQLRRSMTRLESYEANVKSARSYLDAGETTLRQVEEIIHSVTETWTVAMTDSSGDAERDILCNQLKNLREELLSLMNGRFSDRYLYGGSNTITAPFTVDGDGNLYYNGVNMQDIDKHHDLMSDAIWIDIGLGVSFDSDNPQEVQDNTAFNMAMVGAEVFGTGSDNLYLVLTDMINMLEDRNYDKDQMGDVLTKFQGASSYVNAQITRLGADQSYLEFTLDRFSADKINLESRLASVQGIDAEQAILNLKTQEYAYNASLQLGQRLLQPTLFSFIS